MFVKLALLMVVFSGGEAQFEDAASEANFQLIRQNGSAILGEEEGLLLYNGGTVCNDEFSDNSAGAICKIMGFDGAKSWTSGYRIWSTGQEGEFWRSVQEGHYITVEDVRCSSPDWASCTYDDKPVHCHHMEDVFLTCNGSRSYDGCAEGEYLSSETCRKCPPNTYSPHAGAGSCTACPDTSTSTAGSSFCVCEAGKYWTPPYCRNCPKGSTSEVGSTSCSCEAGKYWKQQSCLTCPPGSNSEVGSKSFQNCTYKCPPGKVWISSPCVCERLNYMYSSYIHTDIEGSVLCPDGDYDDVGDGLKNIWSNIGLGREVCRCPDKMYWSWRLKRCFYCTDCHPGTYKNEEMSTCTDCPLNATSLAGSDHCSCQEGSFWNGSHCEKCPKDTVSQEGSLNCTPCPSGSTTTESQQTACRCPKGQTWSWSAGEQFGSCQSVSPDPMEQDPIQPDPTQQDLTFTLLSVLTGLSGLSVIVSIILVLLHVKEKGKGKDKDIGEVRVAYNAGSGLHTSVQEKDGKVEEAHTSRAGPVKSSCSAAGNPETWYNQPEDPIYEYAD